MGKRRRRHEAVHKFEIALEAFEGSKTIGQFSSGTRDSPQYDTVCQLHTGLTAYFDFYSLERTHPSPDYRTPVEELFVLCSEPAAFAQMHPILPISWSND